MPLRLLPGSPAPQLTPADGELMIQHSRGWEVEAGQVKDPCDCAQEDY